MHRTALKYVSFAAEKCGGWLGWLLAFQNLHVQPAALLQSSPETQCLFKLQRVGGDDYLKPTTRACKNFFLF